MLVILTPDKAFLTGRTEMEDRNEKLARRLLKGSNRINEMRREIKGIISMLHSFIVTARIRKGLPDVHDHFRYSETCSWYFKLGTGYGVIEFCLAGDCICSSKKDPSLEHVQMIYDSLDFLLETALKEIPCIRMIWQPLLDAAEFAESAE